MGVILEPCSQIGVIMLTFWCYLSGLGKKRENGVPQGGVGCGHAMRSCLCMFREDRPLLPWLHFWFYFGVILGAKFATILFFSHPSRQHSPQKVPFFQCVFLMDFRVRQGGWGGETSPWRVCGPVVKLHLAHQIGGKPARETMFQKPAV